MLKRYLVTYIRKQRKYEHREDYSKDMYRRVKVFGEGRNDAIRNFYNRTPKDFEKLHTVVRMNWEE